MSLAGPPGFEPGTLPQVGFLARLFGWLPMGSKRPEVKASTTPTSVSDALPFQDPEFEDLTELRALRLPRQLRIKSLLQLTNPHPVSCRMPDSNQVLGDSIDPISKERGCERKSAQPRQVRATEISDDA